MGNIESASDKSSAGFALILSYDKYNNKELRSREGNDKDIKELRDVLTLMEFEYHEYHNLTSAQTKQKIVQVSASGEFSKYSTLVVIVLTHGWYSGVLYATDTCFFTSDVWGPLRNSPNFKNKPKILIFQACRGEVSETSMTSGQIPCLSNPVNDPQFVYSMPALPHEKNFFIAFSTVEDTVSIRNEMTGSWYIETLCSEIKVNKSAVNLSTLLTRVTYIIVNRSTGKFAQTPSFVSFLPYDLYIKPLTSSTASALTQYNTVDSASALLSDNPSETEETLLNKFDGQVNLLAQLKNVPTHFVWKYPKKGRAFIFYTSFYEAEAKILQTALNSMQLEAEIHVIAGINIFTVLEAVSTQPELADENCMLVAVLSQIRSDEGSQESHIAGKLISKIWSPFIASKCRDLHEKPKIFLYMDIMDTFDQRYRMQSTPFAQGGLFLDNAVSQEQVTNNVDFLHIYGFGRAYFNALVSQLQLGYDNHSDIYDILSKTKKQTIQEMEGKNILMRRLPYYTSTLRSLFYFEKELQPQAPPSKLALQETMREQPTYIDEEMMKMRNEIRKLTDEIAEAKTQKDSVPIDSDSDDDDKQIVLKIDKKKIGDDFHRARQNIASAVDDLQNGFKTVVDVSVDKITEVAPIIVQNVENIVENVENIVENIPKPRDIGNIIKSWF